MARSRTSPTLPSSNEASTVEDSRLADLAGRKKRKFRFQVRNDFAGTFGGELLGTDADDVRAQLIARLTAGIQVFEVI